MTGRETKDCMVMAQINPGRTAIVIGDEAGVPPPMLGNPS